mmetsp:Transcript_4142/g.4853  ORF Transcript_4142/g.4853 Transcript_4142/m.4853 type:complete len:204 (-) Transcript_4142:90-701(-)
MAVQAHELALCFRYLRLVSYAAGLKISRHVFHVLPHLRKLGFVLRLHKRHLVLIRHLERLHCAFMEPRPPSQTKLDVDTTTTTTTPLRVRVEEMLRLLMLQQVLAPLHERRHLIRVARFDLPGRKFHRRPFLLLAGFELLMEVPCRSSLQTYVPLKLGDLIPETDDLLLGVFLRTFQLVSQFCDLLLLSAYRKFMALDHSPHV